ncbi:MAG: DUF3427 domain-containing protein [Clostridiales bacterium]|nr:DUF3427 domain-containing protein [Clostridiales bacterium]
MLYSGLYEQVIDKKLKEEINAAVDKETQSQIIDSAQASKILTKHLEKVIQNKLDVIAENTGKLEDQIKFVNDVIKSITLDNELLSSYSVEFEGKQLLSVVDKTYGNNKINKIVSPETSLSQSSLFTGAVNEPSMFSELKKEILSSNRIDMLVSFIKWSGLRLIYEELKTFTYNGGKLRIITTSYMGATDVKAVEELRKLSNTEIKVSYDTKRTRLHAKTYVFYRNTGFSTAYIGSSNLSNAAISSGLEWNVKVTAQDLFETIQKMEATFESYWNSIEFEKYDESKTEQLVNALKSERHHEQDTAYMMDVNPYSYQQEILDKLKAEREIRNLYKNLIVAATGTGKTVISAFDYKRLCKENPSSPCRLLFVAHREEILKQSISCFRNVLKDQNFGDLFVGGYNQPEDISHLFLSIQTFNSHEWYKNTDENYYDYIIIDEFHHASAKSYQKLLSYYKPKILLGLTATPERMDGEDITKYFDYRIAAEIRLPEAINRKLLCPFHYFGVTDTVDLDSLKWSRGKYNVSELEKVYLLDKAVADKRANNIIKSIIKYVTDIEEVKGLGFCVSIEHAKYMAEFFNTHNIPSIHLTGNSATEERNTAKEQLVSGKIKFIFVVDLYNEGVDIPEVNTVLFLRPTESLTVFLQQLGRGLRLSESKDCLTVLDFIGQANKNYRFEDKFSALLDNSKRSISKEIKDGFLNVPAGCYVQLEKKAKEYILNNISSSFGTKSALISKISTFSEDTNLELNLANFVDYYHLNLSAIYKRASFSRLCVAAGVIDDFEECLEEPLTKSLKRISFIDSRRLIEFALDLLSDNIMQYENFSYEQKRMTNMLQFTFWQKSFENCGFSNPLEGFEQIKANPTMCNEIKSLLNYKFNKIDFIDKPIDLGFACPLDLHCTYSRDQILVAMDFMKPDTVREGVKYLSDKKIDLLFVTLNKSDKDYSPTTMYQDYSINDTLFHWQSQSTVSETSRTGQRYINHKSTDNRIALFVRDKKNDDLGAAPYTFLGLADYVSHQGSYPMNIIFKLYEPIPAKYVKITNKLILG